MSATAVEKITHLPNEPRGPVRQNPSPRKRHLLRWSLVALIAGGIVLTVLLGLVQKFLWMRGTRLRGHILDPPVGQVGNVWRRLGLWALYIWGSIFALQPGASAFHGCAGPPSGLPLPLPPAGLSLPLPMQAEESTSL